MLSLLSLLARLVRDRVELLVLSPVLYAACVALEVRSWKEIVVRLMVAMLQLHLAWPPGNEGVIIYVTHV